MPIHIQSRVALTTSLLAGLAGLAVVAAPPATAGPTTIAELQTGFAGCTGTSQSPYVVTLSQSLSDTAAIVTDNCVAVLDLNGFDLTAATVVVAATRQLTIRDTSPAASGVLTVAGKGDRAGIQTADATLVIASGVVHATGGNGASAIGGSFDASANYDGGTVRVDGGTVVATVEDAAAIGASRGPTTPATFTMTGGDVTATATNNGAGVGGGADAAGSAVTVSGGTLRAYGGFGGAGIGSGARSFMGVTQDSGSLVMTGGTVLAVGGTGGGAAGVGGGLYGGAADVSISGGTLTASGTSTAVGANRGLAEGVGSLTLTGTGVLDLPSGNLVLPDSDPTGPELIVGSGALIKGSADIVNPDGPFGQIQNDGTITVPTSHLLVGVTHRAYALSFVGTPQTVAPVGVFATDFASGERPFPAVQAQPGASFVGWLALLPDHTLTALDADSDLTRFGSAGSGSVEIPVAAVYQAPPVVTGVAKVGRTLTGHVPISGPQPGSVATTYQWFRVKGAQRQAIGGATKPTHRVRPVDRGRRLVLQARVSGPARTTVTTTSEPTAPIRPGLLRRPAKPRLELPATGRPLTGTTVTATFARRLPGVAVAGLKRHFRWYAGTTRVGGDAARLRVTAAMVGKRLRLAVTYSAPGYRSLTISSAASRGVAASRTDV